MSKTWMSRDLTRAAVLLLAAAGGAPPGAAAPPDTDAARTRALVEAKLAFQAYVFDGADFPACEFEQPAAMKDLIGPYSIKTTFYDRRQRPVDSAGAPGPYAAVLEVTSEAGRTLRRYATLFRTAEKVAPDYCFRADAPAELARRTGLDVAAVRREAEVIAGALKDRPFGDWARDPRAARLLAGLSLDRGGREPVHKYDDAFALERQWWVDLKRTLTGLDRVFTTPADRPRPLDGAPAPVVRAGTPAEAGMKPDAADRIDAVCREWAADDDQAFAVCIVRHGVIVLHRAYGTRDGRPMTAHTRSWMASITKPMAATLLMMLVDQGLVGLDDPADRYLPALRGIPVPRPLTVRHLYTHTSGLDAWPAELYHDDLPDIEERVALAYPELRVGKRWAYNGQGYTLGGKIIEMVSGEALPQFYHRHLLGPLGCDETDVTGTHADASSVPLDIARFGQMLLNGGAYGRWRFLRPETFEQMLPERLTKVLGPDAEKTLGIGLEGRRDRFGHGAASAATFSVNRTDDLVVIMTRNKMGKNQEKYNGKFWDAVRAGMEEK
jgi:CubicO group peptidase (beta-lactamase class C family)